MTWLSPAPACDVPVYDAKLLQLGSIISECLTKLHCHHSAPPLWVQLTPAGQRGKTCICEISAPVLGARQRTQHAYWCVSYVGTIRAERGCTVEGSTDFHEMGGWGVGEREWEKERKIVRTDRVAASLTSDFLFSTSSVQHWRSESQTSIKVLPFFFERWEMTCASNTASRYPKSIKRKKQNKAVDKVDVKLTAVSLAVSGADLDAVEPKWWIRNITGLAEKSQGLLKLSRL